MALNYIKINGVWWAEDTNTGRRVPVPKYVPPSEKPVDITGGYVPIVVKEPPHDTNIQPTPSPPTSAPSPPANTTGGYVPIVVKEPPYDTNIQPTPLPPTYTPPPPEPTLPPIPPQEQINTSLYNEYYAQQEANRKKIEDNIRIIEENKRVAQQSFIRGMREKNKRLAITANVEKQKTPTQIAEQNKYLSEIQKDISTVKSKQSSGWNIKKEGEGYSVYREITPVYVAPSVYDQMLNSMVMKKYIEAGFFYTDGHPPMGLENTGSVFVKDPKTGKITFVSPIVRRSLGITRIIPPPNPVQLRPPLIARPLTPAQRGITTNEQLLLSNVSNKLQRKKLDEITDEELYLIWTKMPAVQQNVITASSATFENPGGLSSFFYGNEARMKGGDYEAQRKAQFMNVYKDDFRLLLSKDPVKYAQYAVSSIPGTIFTGYVAGGASRLAWQSGFVGKTIVTGFGVYGAKTGIEDVKSMVDEGATPKQWGSYGSRFLTGMVAGQKGWNMVSWQPKTTNRGLRFAFRKAPVIGEKIGAVTGKISKLTGGKVNIPSPKTFIKNYPVLTNLTTRAVSWGNKGYEIVPLITSVRPYIARGTGKALGKIEIPETTEMYQGGGQFPTVSSIREYEQSWRRGGVHGTTQYPKIYKPTETLNEYVIKSIERERIGSLSEVFKKSNLQQQTIMNSAKQNDLVLGGSTAMRLQTKFSLTRARRFFRKSPDYDFMSPTNSISGTETIANRMASDLSKATGQKYTVSVTKSPAHITYHIKLGEKVVSDITVDLPQTGFIGAGQRLPMTTRTINGIRVADPKWLIYNKIEIAQLKGLRLFKPGTVEKAITDLQIMRGEKTPELVYSPTGVGEGTILKRGPFQQKIEILRGRFGVPKKEFALGYGIRSTQSNPVQIQTYHQYPRGMASRWMLGLENETQYRPSVVRRGYKAKPQLQVDTNEGLITKTEINRLIKAYDNGPDAFLHEASAIQKTYSKPVRMPTYKLINQLYNEGKLAEWEAGYFTGAGKFEYGYNPNKGMIVYPEATPMTLTGKLYNSFGRGIGKITGTRQYIIDTETGRSIDIIPVRPKENGGIKFNYPSAIKKIGGREVTPEEYYSFLEERGRNVNIRYQPLINERSVSLGLAHTIERPRYEYKQKGRSVFIPQPRRETRRPEPERPRPYQYTIERPGPTYRRTLPEEPYTYRRPKRVVPVYEPPIRPRRPTPYEYLRQPVRRPPPHVIYRQPPPVKIQKPKKKQRYRFDEGYRKRTFKLGKIFSGKFEFNQKGGRK